MISGEKILITGASGLVGMELARDLARTNEVWGLARYLYPEDRSGAINAWAVARTEAEALGVRTIAADLMGDLSHVPSDFTYLIHLAHTRLPLDRLAEAIETNAVSAGRIMHHCRTAKAVLMMSSTAVYAPPDDVWHLLREGDPMGGAKAFHNPTSPNAKIGMEAVSQFCALEFNLPTIIMRSNVVYGPKGGLPTRDLHRVAAGERLSWFGDPYPHSPIHFDDMRDQIEALLGAADRTANIVNWCGDEVVTQRQWCEMAADMAGLPLDLIQTPGAPGNSADPTKRISITGPCKRSFKDGYAEVFAAFSSTRDKVLRQLEITRANAGTSGAG